MHRGACFSFLASAPKVRSRTCVVTGLLGNFVWFRPGLCQCRFRISYKGLYRASIAAFTPASAGLAPPVPAAQLLPISPGRDLLRFSLNRDSPGGCARRKEPKNE
jgi:hypothetical protein